MKKIVASTFVIFLFSFSFALAGVVEYGNKLNIKWDGASISGNPLITLTVWYGCESSPCKSNEQRVVREVFAKDNNVTISIGSPIFHISNDAWFNLYDSSHNLLASSMHFKISNTKPASMFMDTVILDQLKSGSSSTTTNSVANPKTFPLKARCEVKSTGSPTPHFSFTSGSEGGVAPYKYTWTLGSSEFDNLSTVSVDEAHQVGIKVVDGMGSVATSTCSDITPSTFTQNTESCLNLNMFLGLGSRGNDVTLLQKFLINQGFLKTEASGYFGQATYGALKAFQSANAIDLTGSAGPITRSRINKLSCTH